MDFFVWQPGRVAAVAGAFLLAFIACVVLERINHRFRSWPLFAATVLWGLYALWEWLAFEKRWNIRVDLLLIYPLLFGASITALVLSYRWKRSRE
jgi:hypothetical protein